MTYDAGKVWTPETIAREAKEQQNRRIATLEQDVEYLRLEIERLKKEKK